MRIYGKCNNLTPPSTGIRCILLTLKEWNTQWDKKLTYLLHITSFDVMQIFFYCFNMLKVPSLGMHYTEKWAEEDLIEEQQEGRNYIPYITDYTVKPVLRSH